MLILLLVIVVSSVSLMAILVLLYLIGMAWVLWAFFGFFYALWAIIDFVNGHYLVVGWDLAAAALNFFIAWSVYNDKNNRRKQKKAAELLGHKARAARDRLVASIPQGRTNPGFNPA